MNWSQPFIKARSTICGWVGKRVTDGCHDQGTDDRPDSSGDQWADRCEGQFLFRLDTGNDPGRQVCRCRFMACRPEEIPQGLFFMVQWTTRE